MEEIIKKLIDNAISKYGLEDKKTRAIVENANKIEKQYKENLIKIY